MQAETEPNGSLVLTSAGDRFGDPGFYFTLHDASGIKWARYVRAMRETIRVYAAEEGSVRADHILKSLALRSCGCTIECAGASTVATGNKTAGPLSEPGCC